MNEPAGLIGTGVSFVRGTWGKRNKKLWKMVKPEAYNTHSSNIHH